MQQPPWMAAAWRELGQREQSGSAANRRILDLFRDAGHPSISSDETAWCAAFVGACLERAGLPSTRALNARSYLIWGEALDTPKSGAIAVLRRGADPALGHVGFIIGATDEALILLGGNQGDAVTVAAFDMGEVLAVRWPSHPPTAPAASSPSELFERCLAHVLEMEGGYTDDPHDPGGPTNLGITLAVWARARRVEVSSLTFEPLKAELKSITIDDARPIYLERYWQPSQAGQLPPALAIMHFDASVNHGVGRAARMLQQAVGVTVDGEIGPETLAAAGLAERLPTHLERYAEIRRASYRSLPHFWRFGRGWLRRVEATLPRARALSSSPKPNPLPEISDMTLPPVAAEPKWWGQSLTIWGALLTAVSTVLPVLGPLLGINITADLARLLGEQLIAVAQALGGLIGTLMTILGRSRADAPLARRLLPGSR